MTLSQRSVSRFPHISFPSEPGPHSSYPRQNSAVTLPIGRQWPVLVAAWPMSQDEWDAMMRLLEVMRPGLTGTAPR